MKIKTFTRWNGNRPGAEKKRGFIPLGNNRILEGRNNFSFLLSALFFVSVLPSFAQTNLVTPYQYLASQPKPNFAQAHHLPPLTRWGGGFYTNDMIELANHWGYALEFNMYVTPNEVTNDMLKPGTMPNLWLSMVSNNPSKYKLCVMLDRTVPYSPIPCDWFCTNSGGWMLDTKSNLLQYTNSGFSGFVTNGMVYAIPPTNFGWLAMSPECPDVYLTNQVAYCISSLKAVQSNAPIAVILNGGEYDLDCAAWGLMAWMADPRVQAQPVMTNPFAIQNPAASGGWQIVNTNGMSWGRYSSNQKAHQVGFLTSAIQQNFPNRQLSIFYRTDNELGRSYNHNSQNNEYWEDVFGTWGWNSDVMNTNTDLPSFEFYYSGVGSWTNVPQDFLSQYLNQVGYNINLGYRTNYCWIDGGRCNDGNQCTTDINAVSDIPRYTGWLKCLYMGGMNGAVVYQNGPNPTNPPGWQGAFPSNSPPNWLQQLMALSHVHALFSHLERIITNSDLISGPQVHVRATDQPAWEFTNTVGRLWQDRVLARKVRGTNEWIVCAWAADGNTTNVTVNISTLGNLTVNAVPSASVYQVTMTGTNVQQTLLDEYASFPPAPPVDLRVLPK